MNSNNISEIKVLLQDYIKEIREILETTKNPSDNLIRNLNELTSLSKI